MAPSRRTQAAVAQRRAQVLTMRAAGATFQTIADQLGHKTAAAAVQDLTRALRSRNAQLSIATDLHVTLELERLDKLERITQTLLASAADPDSASHDPLQAVRCVDRLVRISQHRSALLGLSGARLGPVADVPPAPAAGADRFDEIAAARDRRRAGTTHR